MELFKAKAGGAWPHQIGQSRLSHKSELLARLPPGAYCGRLS